MTREQLEALLTLVINDAEPGYMERVMSLVDEYTDSQVDDAYDHMGGIEGR